jgi:hypothetical protein
MNEKLLETLFNRFALQFFRLGEAWVHTPSSREEFINGYDSRIVAVGSLREIVLQFKKPNPTRGGFTITLTPHQHKKLRSLYPPGMAYYVSATFRDFREIQDAQRQVTKAADFLRYYVAVEIGNTLPNDVQFIQYERNDDSWLGRNVKYKCEEDGNTRKARHAVSSRGGWESGTNLIRKFKQRKAGSLVRLFQSNDEKVERHQSDLCAPLTAGWSPSIEHLKRVDADFPTALRVG